MYIHQSTTVYWTHLSFRKMELEPRSFPFQATFFPFFNFSFGHRTPFWNILHWRKGKNKNCFGWSTGLGRDWSPTCPHQLPPLEASEGLTLKQWPYEALLTLDSEQKRHRNWLAARRWESWGEERQMKVLVPTEACASGPSPAFWQQGVTLTASMIRGRYF